MSWYVANSAENVAENRLGIARICNVMVPEEVALCAFDFSSGDCPDS